MPEADEANGILVNTPQNSTTSWFLRCHSGRAWPEWVHLQGSQSCNNGTYEQGQMSEADETDNISDVSEICAELVGRVGLDESPLRVSVGTGGG